MIRLCAIGSTSGSATTYAQSSKDLKCNRILHSQDTVKEILHNANLSLTEKLTWQNQPPCRYDLRRTNLKTADKGPILVGTGNFGMQMCALHLLKGDTASIDVTPIHDFSGQVTIGRGVSSKQRWVTKGHIIRFDFNGLQRFWRCGRYLRQHFVRRTFMLPLRSCGESLSNSTFTDTNCSSGATFLDCQMTV